MNRHAELVVCHPRRAARAGLVAVAIVAAWVAALAGGAAAQELPATAPDAKAMIEALKPRQTRSLRNLGVRPGAASEAPAVPTDGPGRESPAVPPSTAPPDAGAADSGRPGVQPVRPAPAPTAPEAPPNISLAIGFDFDSARIRADSLSVLTQLALAMQSPELADSRFLVEGHTDARGGPDYNLRLSQSRADEVQRFLVARGVAADRLASVGKGSAAPADAAHPLAAVNRRVRIVNLERGRQ
jgi:outer membrane protein OmpA-like peptidoglycan-associated protein